MSLRGTLHVVPLSSACGPRLLPVQLTFSHCTHLRLHFPSPLTRFRRVDCNPAAFILYLHHRRASTHPRPPRFTLISRASFIIRQHQSWQQLPRLCKRRVGRVDFGETLGSRAGTEG
jgi:hypothetical protein